MDKIVPSKKKHLSCFYNLYKWK